MKVVSDGTLGGTRVVDSVTGEEVNRVTDIEWRLSVGGPDRGELRLTVLDVPCEVVGTVQQLNRKVITR